MTYVVRQYEGHCMWEGTHPARAKDTEFETLNEALAYRATLTGVIEIFKREVIK